MDMHAHDPLESHNADLVLPVGTHVVTRGEIVAESEATLPRGAIGTIIAAPIGGDNTYAVRFPDGREAHS